MFPTLLFWRSFCSISFSASNAACSPRLPGLVGALHRDGRLILHRASAGACRREMDDRADRAQRFRAQAGAERSARFAGRRRADRSSKYDSEHVGEHRLSRADFCVLGRAEHTDFPRGQGAAGCSAASRRSACSILWQAEQSDLRPVCCLSCSCCSARTGSTGDVDEAGYLSPERIQNTVLLAKIITFIPFLNV